MTLLQEFWKEEDAVGGCRDYFNIGGNINPLLWGGYKVYRVKICG